MLMLNILYLTNKQLIKLNTYITNIMLIIINSLLRVIVKLININLKVLIVLSSNIIGFIESNNCVLKDTE